MNKIFKRVRYGVPALFRKIKRIILRQPLFVNEMVEAAREKTCKRCQFLKDSECTVCACYVKLKIQFADEACPIGKW